MGLAEHDYMVQTHVVALTDDSLDDVLVDGNLLTQGEDLGGQAEAGRQKRSDQKVNRLDDAHEKVSQSCPDTAVVPRGRGIKPRNSLTANEYGITDRDS
jgi:hypothetical protein